MVWKLCSFYKTLNYRSPVYPFSLLPSTNSHYVIHNYSWIGQNLWKANNFINSILFYSCREWDKFNSSIGQAPPYAVFCELYRPTRNTTFGIKNLTRVRVNFINLRITDLNIIFKICWTHCSRLPFRQKTFN